MGEETKRYLGDGVYASMCGDGILMLTTETGYDIPTNTIYLELDVYAELVRFMSGQ